MLKRVIKKSQRGYSLVELSITTAITSVVIAGTIMGVQSILRTNNVNKTISQTNTATNKIVAKLSRESSYAGATTANLTAAGMEVWDNSAIVSAGNVVHAFGNNIYVAPLSATQYEVDANQGYVYTLTGIPEAACSDLAVGIEGMALAMGIVNQAAVTSAQTSIPTGTAVVKKPGTNFNFATANGLCNGTADSATITLLIPRR